MRILWLALISCFLTVNLFGKNVGKVDYPGHIEFGAKTNWDSVVVFKIRKKSKVYRALSDIETEIKQSNNGAIFGSIGAIGKCAIALVLKRNSDTNLHSALVGATDYGDLYEIYSKSKWSSFGENKYDSRSSSVNQCR